MVLLLRDRSIGWKLLTGWPKGKEENESWPAVRTVGLNHPSFVWAPPQNNSLLKKGAPGRMETTVDSTAAREKMCEFGSSCRLSPRASSIPAATSNDFFHAAGEELEEEVAAAPKVGKEIIWRLL